VGYNYYQCRGGCSSVASRSVIHIVTTRSQEIVVQWVRNSWLTFAADATLLGVLHLMTTWCASLCHVLVCVVMTFVRLRASLLSNEKRGVFRSLFCVVHAVASTDALCVNSV
jgi:hypothetical protein